MLYLTNQSIYLIQSFPFISLARPRSLHTCIDRLEPKQSNEISGKHVESITVSLHLLLLRPVRVFKIPDNAAGRFVALWAVCQCVKLCRTAISCQMMCGMSPSQPARHPDLAPFQHGGKELNRNNHVPLFVKPLSLSLHT